MKITLSPARRDEQLTARVTGDTLYLNGEAIDFTPLQEGDVLPYNAIDNPFIGDDVRRIDGEIHLTLVLPYGANAPYETRFPAAFSEPMTVVNGAVPLPAYDAVEQETTS